MATLNITINYPDNKQQELIDALRWHYGKVEEEDGPRVRTPAELKQVFDNEVKARLVKIHKNYIESQQATPDLGATV
jgi:hypothetical protein